MHKQYVESDDLVAMTLKMAHEMAIEFKHAEDRRIFCLAEQAFEVCLIAQELRAVRKVS